MPKPPSTEALKRGLSGLGVGAVLALIPHMLGAGWLVTVGQTIFVAGLALLAGSAGNVLVAVPLALAFSSVVLFVLGRVVGTFEIDATPLVISIVLISAIAALVPARAARKPMPQMSQSAQPSVWLSLSFVLIIGLLNNPSRSWNAEQGFGILASNGEDNASWLLALSQSVRGGHTVLTELSGTGGGPASGLFVVFWREIMNWMDPGSATVSADNGLVLVRLYPLMATLAAILVLTVSAHVLGSRGRWVQVSSTLIASVLAYSLMTGLATVGHLSAGVAGVFLLAAVALAMIACPTTRTGQVAVDGGVTVTLFAAGQAWFPLTFLALMYLFVRLGTAAGLVIQSSGVEAVKRLILTVVGAVVASVVVVRLLFSDVFGNFTDLDYIRKNLTLPGGYATVSPWIAAASLVTAVALIVSNWESTTERRQSALVLTLVIPPTALFTWSYFLAPYTPQYGAWKYLYLAVIAVGPLAAAVATDQAARSGGQRAASATVAACAALVVLFPPPLTHANWASEVGKTRNEWVDPIVRELRSDPTRPVGCLNTLKDDQTQNYIAYLCSRMAFGLGGFDEIHHRVWTAANLCAAPPEQVQAEWTQERQRNLTIILFDGTRSTSRAGCQTGDKPFERGWLTAVDLNLTRNLDIRGDSASPED